MLAENLLDFVAKYEAEEHLVDMRWNNLAVQRQIKGHGLGELSKEPKAIEINFDGEVQQVSGSGYQNPFS